MQGLNSPESPTPEEEAAAFQNLEEQKKEEFEQPLAETEQLDEAKHVATTEAVDHLGETEEVKMLENNFLNRTDRMDDTEVVNRIGADLARLRMDLCPKLITGSHLNKECSMKPDRWLKIGRNPKAHVLLNNAGVSRDHCSLRWDKYRRLVELRDESTSGTYINGEAMAKGAKTVLTHGDNITIHGKDTKYEFLVDLRPVGMATADPREVHKARQHAAQAAAPTSLSQRRAILKSQLKHLHAEIESADKKVFATETTYFETVTRRNLRVKEDQEREEQHRQLVEGAKDKAEHLKESRKEWLQKLEAEYKKNEEGVSHIVEGAASLQDKVEKLQLKKDELERSIHPERYAIADISRHGSVPDMPTPRAISREGGDEGDDAEGEEKWDEGPEPKRLKITEES